MWRRGAPALAALALALAGSAGCGAAAAEARGAAPFAVSATLGDHMVLQRAPQSAAVWGFAPEGTVVRATFDGMTYTSTAGADEVWRVHLTPTAAGGPHTIALAASTGETALLSDVLFGDAPFEGRLSFGWPRDNAQARREAREEDPLFRRGFGL